jgi:hypothetical protein
MIHARGGVIVTADYNNHAFTSWEAPGTAEASIVASVDGSKIQGAVRADPSMALVLVVLVALGVVGMALYVVQLAIKRRRR